MISGSWAHNRDVHLHYLDSQADGPGLPLVFVPGLRGHAEHFRPMLAALAPRRALAVSLRGRGQSHTPDTGYTFAHHVGDIAAVLAHARLSRCCLVGHSVGAAYAIGCALAHPDQVAGLVLAGYPAAYPSMSADWALHVLSAYPGEMSAKALLGIQQESEAVDLWGRLAELRCPLLVLRGGKASSRLDAETAQKYQIFAPHAQIVVFADAGHRLWVPDFDRFIGVLSAFAAQLDAPGG
jgi:pimeloyl-ACP methyl ester carboxylesterase